MTRIISQSRNAPTYACDVLLRYGLATARKTLKKVKSKKKKKKGACIQIKLAFAPCAAAGAACKGWFQKCHTHSPA